MVLLTDGRMFEKEDPWEERGYQRCIFEACCETVAPGSSSRLLIGCFALPGAPTATHHIITS